MDELINLNVLAAVEEAEINNLAPRRIFHQRDNPLEILSDKKFVRTYRLTKDMVRNLVFLLEPYIVPPSRESALSVTTKVLTALNFFAYGSYQFGIGQNINAAVSQSSVSRAIEEVVDALNQPNVFNQYVHFPRNMEELRRLRNQFFHKYHIPGIIGCIDCTHVAIYPPYNNEEQPEQIYVNRKGFHSINTQIICDSNYKILNILARFPGSTHDAYIWNNSNVKPFLEDLHERGHKSFFLLGDSGYPLRSYLLTPFDTALPGSPQWRYNERHSTVRSIVERCNGILKLRFRCLLKHRVLHYAPAKAGKIINACAVLHNMCIAHGLPNVDPEPDDGDIDLDLFDQYRVAEPIINVRERRNQPLEEGREQRNIIIRQLFN